MALDVIINFLERGADAIRDALRDTERGIDDVNDAAGEGAGDGLEEGAAQALLFNERLENLANSGAKLKELGGAATDMARGWAQAAEEGGALETRMEAILKTQGKLADLPAIDESIQRVTVEGHFDDDDAIRQAAIHLQNAKVEAADLDKLLESTARASRSTGQSLDGVARSIAKAYGSGNAAGLKKLNVHLNEQEKAALKAAYAQSQQAGQTKFTELVTNALARSTAGLADSLTDAQKNANDLARGWDDMQTALGKGSAEAEANINKIKASILGLAGSDEAILKQAGMWTMYGGTAATAAGSTLEVMGNAGMAAQGFIALKGTAVGSMLAAKLSVMGVIGALALIVTAAVAAREAILGVQNAQKMSDENLRKSSVLGGFWVDAGAKIGNSRVGRLLIGGESWNSSGIDASKPLTRQEIRNARLRNQKSRTNGGTRVTFKADPITILNGQARSAARS